MGEKRKADILSWIRQNRPAAAAVFLLLLGFCLLSLCKCSAQKAENLPDTEPSGYRQELEERLKSLLEGMNGVGRARVFVTLEQGYEKVYANGRDRVEKVKEPFVKGVVVVCAGGGDRAVCARVTEAVATALGIGWDRVSVQPLGP